MRPDSGSGPAAFRVLRDAQGRLLRKAVEYCVVDHCNLACAGCDHASPHLPRHFADLESFTADMRELAKHLHVRVLRIIGGEPLLHPHIAAFVEAARQTGIADSLSLWTNGLLIHSAPLQLLASFDLVRVSLYPGVKIAADLTTLARELRHQTGTKLEVHRVSRFLHQLIDVPVSDQERVRRTYLRCKDAHLWNCHTVRDGWYYKCAKAPLLQARLANVGIDIDNRIRDGVKLHSNPDIALQLQEYLASPQPLVACQWCLGTDGKSFRHHQLARADRIRKRTAQSTIDGMRVGFARQLWRDLRDRFETQGR